MPQSTDETVEVTELVPKEQILEHIVDEIVGGRVMKGTTETAKIIPRERVPNRAVWQIMNVLVPQIRRAQH